MPTKSTKITLPSENSNIDAKFRLFAIKYSENPNVNELALDFKVKASVIRQWARRPDVQCLIDVELAKLSQNSLVNKRMLEMMSLEVYDKAMESKVQPDLGSANKAISTLHKMQIDEEKIRQVNESGSLGTTIINISADAFNTNTHFEMLQKNKEKDIN